MNLVSTSRCLAAVCYVVHKRHKIGPELTHPKTTSLDAHILG